MIAKTMLQRSEGRASRQTMLDGFYRAFEDRFRGSREMIRDRLKVYLPFIEPLKSIEEQPAAVDLGCGRGEWLELLRDNGFDARGVDLDEKMLAACHERGLAATKGDAITFLEKLPNESCVIVSGFHIAEHLPFSQLQVLVHEAFRVLKPAGFLILETPNPENFKVSSLTFHLDPTHRNPIPPALLAFLPEYFGFSRYEVIRLNESPVLRESHAASLEEVMTGASPDYAVVAQKMPSEPHADLFQEAFDRQVEIGLNQDMLYGRFDRRLAVLTRQVVDLKGRLEEGLNEDYRAIAELEARLTGATAASEARIAQVERAKAILEAQLAAVYTSSSWRVTKPLRFAGHTGRWLTQGALAWLTFRPESRPRRIARHSATTLAQSVRAHPHLAKIAKRVVQFMPATIRSRLWSIASQATPMASASLPLQLSDLSPRARQIHAMLKVAMDERQRAG